MRTSETLRNDVEQELRWEPSVRAEKIGMSVNKGVVELDGHVGSLYEQWAAERTVLRVVNVTSVASAIIVDLPFDNLRTDEDIAQAARNHLTWNLLMPATVKVKVTEGRVTLLGTTEWQYQREEAERIVKSLHGVKAVVNDIGLQPKLMANGLKIKIEDALKRDAQIDPNNITVETAGNVVTLLGHVHSWRERMDAEHVAFAAPGVAFVTNHITIGS